MNELDVAILDAAQAVDLETGRRATGKLLYSVGNNNAGKYRAIALDVVPKFAGILGSDIEWRNPAAYCNSFAP